jgi:hypothetical protein
MVKVHFHYREIEDSDFTGIVVHFEEEGVVRESYSNFDPAECSGSVWGNQREVFQLATIQQARAFLNSSGCYKLLERTD